MKPLTRIDDDDGFTMTELVVSLTILAIMLTIFTTGIVQMYSAANKTESMATAQSQLNTVFLRLDKQVRYAAGISQPSRVGTTWYVGILTTTTGVQMCTGVRLDTANGQLSTTTWDDDDAPTTPGWSTLATGVAAPAGGQPFTLEPANAVSNFYRFRLTLVASAGSAKTASTTSTDVTFTAVNTSLSTSSEFACTRYWSP